MKEYDLILPMGTNCRPVYYMKKLGFRTKAYPLDWNAYSLRDVIGLYENNFEDYFDNYRYDDVYSTDENKRKLRDTKYGVLDLHHFTTLKPMEEQIGPFKEKAKMRFNRLKDDVNRANTILMISNSTENREDIEEFLNYFVSRFSGKNITFLNIRNLTTGEESYSERVLANGVKIIEHCFYDELHEENVPEWIGNYHKWYEVLEHYSLKSSE